MNHRACSFRGRSAVMRGRHGNLTGGTSGVPRAAPEPEQRLGDWLSTLSEGREATRLRAALLPRLGAWLKECYR